jgi:hypothetical protein
MTIRLVSGELGRLGQPLAKGDQPLLGAVVQVPPGAFTDKA